MIISGTFLGDKKDSLYALKVKRIYFNVDESELEKFLNNEKIYFIILFFENTLKSFNFKYKKKSCNLYLRNIVLEVEDIEKSIIEKNNKQLNLEFISWEIEKADYIRLINIIKKEIELGTFYQVNLTNRATFYNTENPKDIFFSFFLSQKVPFAYFLNFNSFFLISGSMELFLKRKKNLIISGPIKGTISKKENIKNLFSEKELSEHLMIVDIMRNDINKVGREIKVKLFKVKKYSTLYHLVSYIYGETSLDNYLLIKNVLPVSSVTGAPKYTACKFIYYNEPFERESYCGISILKLSKDNFISCVNIRHIIGKEKFLYYYSGGGIVFDSDPEKEWKEINLKMQAFLNILKKTKKGV